MWFTPPWIDVSSSSRHSPRRAGRYSCKAAYCAAFIILPALRGGDEIYKTRRRMGKKTQYHTVQNELDSNAMDGASRTAQTQRHSLRRRSRRSSVLCTLSFCRRRRGSNRRSRSRPFFLCLPRRHQPALPRQPRRERITCREPQCRRPFTRGRPWHGRMLPLRAAEPGRAVTCVTPTSLSVP